MPRAVSRGTMLSRARFHADYDNTPDSFATPAELNNEFDDSLAQLWSKLVAADPVRYSTTTNVVTVSQQTTYTLPLDFMNLVSAWRIEGRYRFWVDRFDELDRAEGAIDGYLYGDFLYDQGPRVRVVEQGVDGSETRLEFEYEPPPGRTYEVRYNRAPPFFQDDGDVFDGVAGWENWIVYNLAIKLKQRQEDDTTQLEREIAKIESNIAEMAQQRFIGRAHYVKDTRRPNNRGHRRTTT